MLQNFGQFEYYNSDLQLLVKPNNDRIEKGTISFYEVKSFFNYYSDSFERITEKERELQLPNFYIEFVNENNEKYFHLKALAARKINKNYFENINRFQTTLNSRNLKEINKFQKIVIGDYHDSRDFSNLKDFPYYNKVTFSIMSDKVLLKYLNEINYQEQIIDSVLDASTSKKSLSIGSSDVISIVDLETADLFTLIDQATSVFDESDKIVLKDTKLNSSTIVNKFKKDLSTQFLREKSKNLIKKYEDIFHSEKCKVENFCFKIEKYLGDASGTLLQTYYLPASKDLNQIVDTQVKKDTQYTYKIKTKVVVYGTQYRLASYDIDPNAALATCKMVSSPSFKVIEMELLTQSVVVKPTPQLSPAVVFFNKSNSKNEIGIYLDLRIGTEYLKPLRVNTSDPSDTESEIKFEYSTQQGIFEVFRIDKKPKSYLDFADQKLMDVQNRLNSTSVSFKDYILPNNKYYYMFRSLSTSNEPSNPSPIYEVELLKDSDDSKISVKVHDIRKEKNYLNRTFKRLIQIKPAFQQSVFDDTRNQVDDLSTFKNTLDTLSLGYATHGIWGRKFKIRIKSTDSGKIIDFNIKFKLSKKKTKEDLE